MKTTIIILSIIVLILFFLLINLHNKNKNITKDLNTLCGNHFIENKSFLSKIFHPFVEIYEKNNFILYILLSFSLYLLASFDIPDVPIIYKYTLKSQSIENILISSATVILSSGVFSSITKSKHFLSIFSNEIKQIVYTEEFFSKQKDVDKIWNNITKSICKENFHKISDKLFDKVKSNYLPINHKYYYENYNLELHIKYEKINGTDYVTIREVTKVDLICDDKEASFYRSSSNIEYLKEEENETHFKLEEFTINGKDVLSNVKVNSEKKDGKMATYVECPIKDKLKYSIFKIEEKKYSLKLNANRVHSAIKIYHNFDLVVYYPEEIMVRFNKLGQDNSWSPVEKFNLGGGMNYLKTNYDGIFFQNQGYMINLFVI